MKKGIWSFFIALIVSLMTIDFGFAAWNHVTNAYSGNTAIEASIPQTDPVAYIGSKYYSDINLALKEAVSGNTINVMVGNSGRNIDGYTIDTSPELKSGVTMNILYDNSVTSFEKEATLAIRDENALSTSSNCVTCLMVGENVSFVNNGTINVGGQLTSGGSNMANGSTSGKFASIILKNGATLTNNGTMNVYGLIDETAKGTSKIVTEASSYLNVPMRWQDFGSGNVLKAMYDVIGDYESLPLEDFYFENIRNPITINSGATVTSWVNLYVYSMSRHIEYDMKLISSDADSIITIKEDGSYAQFDYDETTMVADLDFYGNTSFNDLTIDVEAASGLSSIVLSVLGLPSKVSTSQGYFPLTYHFDISLNKLESQTKATFSASNMSYKMMNGSKITINDGTEFTAKRLVVYDGTDYTTDRASFISGNMRKSAKYPNASPATLINNGTLAATELSGEVTTGVIGSTINVGTATTETTYEPKDGDGDSKTMTAWFELSHTLNFLNSSNTTTTVSSISAATMYRSYYSSEYNIYYYEVKENKDITSVTISTSSGSTATSAGSSGDFTLNLSYTPSDYASTGLTYQWTLSSGLTLKNGALTDASITVTVPKNSSTETDASYSVSCLVSFTKEDGTTDSKTGTITLTATKTDDSSCLSPGTLITLGDGSTKPIEEITLDDEIMAFNHETGRYESAPMLFMSNLAETTYPTMELTFDDGSSLKLLGRHTLFDMTEMGYKTLDSSNCEDYIGHEFAHYSGGELDSRILLSVETSREYTKAYSIGSYGSYTYVANGFLNVTEIPGFDGSVFDFFQFDPDLRYNEEAKARDIALYGLYDYSRFEQYISRHYFEGAPIRYLKVQVGKGLITEEQVTAMCYIFKYAVDNGLMMVREE